MRRREEKTDVEDGRNLGSKRALVGELLPRTWVLKLCKACSQLCEAAFLSSLWSSDEVAAGTQWWRNARAADRWRLEEKYQSWSCAVATLKVSVLGIRFVLRAWDLGKATRCKVFRARATRREIGT
mmetsp:Transcript_10517/g.27978  ORF Transcript_10517/g.27978 Transcript_10517/m.27978 type:complete len:126 (+) Transcript_10517:177-554(+)